MLSKKFALSIALLGLLVGLLFAIAYIFKSNVSNNKQSSVVKIGIAPDYEPFAFYEGSDVVGFDVDMISAIMEKMGKDFEIKIVERCNLVSSVLNGTVDIALSGIDASYSEERSFARVGYSALFVPNGSCMVRLLNGSEKKNFNTDSRNVFSIGLIKGSVEDHFFRKGGKDNEVEGLYSSDYFLVDNFDALAKHVISGHVDFAFISKDTFKNTKNKAYNKSLECVQIPSTMLGANLVKNYVIVMHNESPLLSPVGEVLRDMVSSGEYDSIRMNWMFGGNR